jgi:intracellular septation protein
MKLLFDLLPLLVFFVTLEVADVFPAGSVVHATEQLGTFVSSGLLGAREAPALLATSLSLAVALVQVLWARLRGRRVPPALWLGVALVAVVGPAWFWLHTEALVKWKPSMLYWMVGTMLWLSQVLLRRNLVRAMLGDHLRLPHAVWQRVNAAWVGFFGLMGLLNLWVAYNYPTAVWLEFTRFGSVGLLLGFVAAQALVLLRHVRAAGAIDDRGRAPR